ncbi:hypothetical protein BT67DRAFT_208988 [Trichocladium antarcticum]|uniref:Uncharacterized protein n=1 Tax=Trichocladium antarcticum TaxID=1450529 RepID=A0AAN6UDL4_9PEZI|nr:hypothetical protein BT67DRAFT_208988 [Trichocladium antarcticum]
MEHGPSSPSAHCESRTSASPLWDTLRRTAAVVTGTGAGPNPRSRRSHPGFRLPQLRAVRSLAPHRPTLPPLHWTRVRLRNTPSPRQASRQARPLLPRAPCRRAHKQRAAPEIAQTQEEERGTGNGERDKKQRLTEVLAASLFACRRPNLEARTAQGRSPHRPIPDLPTPPLPDLPTYPPSSPPVAPCSTIFFLFSHPTPVTHTTSTRMWPCLASEQAAARRHRPHAPLRPPGLPGSQALLHTSE